MITTEQIKTLRDMTGVSVMQCKKALEESGGDMEKAVLVLRVKSADIALKKGDRELLAGVVQAYIHSNKMIGVLVELSCETDFVARNEEFVALARDIAMHVTATDPLCTSVGDISEDIRTKARELLEKEISGVTEERLTQYLAERTLLSQLFVKNPDITIQQLIDGGVQKFGEKIAVARFVRFSVAK